MAGAGDSLRHFLRWSAGSGFNPNLMSTPAATRTPWYRILYLQVLLAVALGIALGYFFPEHGKSLKPLGDGFIKLIKMMIAPIIFCTVVHGVASMGDMKKLGRVGGKTLLYFEVVSTLALRARAAGGEHVLKPGVGFHANDPTDARSPGSGRPRMSMRPKRPRHSARWTGCWA
jgi:Na+/H+-dicarboxylate symporter